MRSNFHLIRSAFLADVICYMDYSLTNLHNTLLWVEHWGWML